MKSSKIPSPIGLLVACLLVACGSSSSQPTVDASADAKDAANNPLPDAAKVADSLVADVPVGDAAPKVDADAGPVDTLVPLVDVAGPDAARLDTAGLDAAQNSDGRIDAQSVDLTTTLDALAIDTASVAQSTFTCSSLGAVASDVSQRLCFDFSDSSQSSNFSPEAGTWSVTGGSYHGIGPTDGQVTCPGGPFAGTAMTTSVLSTPSVANVRVHAWMMSMTRPDKVLVLRAQPSGDRIELNFRSYYIDGQQYGGDFIISTLSACNQTLFDLPGAIPIPQYDYKPIEVDVQLVGQKLTVAVDGKQIYDDTPIATGLDGGTRQLLSAPGRVGFGVFYEGEVAFDDLVVEALK
jgi:hypothetical protein